MRMDANRITKLAIVLIVVLQVIPHELIVGIGLLQVQQNLAQEQHLVQFVLAPDRRFQCDRVQL